MTLTPRENQVLTEYARLGSVKLVSRALGVREQTAKNHLLSARRKLRVHSTVRAVVVAHRMGIIDIGEGKER